MLSTDEIKKIAKLANLKLDDAELSKYQQQLSETLDYIKVLEELNTVSVIPTFQVTGLVNKLRDDTVKESLSPAKVFLNVKKTERGYIVTERVLGVPS